MLRSSVARAGLLRSCFVARSSIKPRAQYRFLASAVQAKAPVSP